MKQIKTFLLVLVASTVLTVALPVKTNAAPPQCFNFNGTDSRPCEDGAGSLQDDRCYTEVRSGPNGTLTGYSETSCDNATDRDMDGVGMATSSSSFSSDCSGSLEASNCGITAYVLLFTNALSAIVGVVIVIMIVVGGIQYSAAQDNPQAVQAARTRIINALIALVLYLFMFAFLQYIVPGGIL